MIVRWTVGVSVTRLLLTCCAKQRPLSRTSRDVDLHLQHIYLLIILPPSS